MDATLIESLPEEVLERILLFVCPYTDLKSCTQVSHKWNRVSRGMFMRWLLLYCRC